MFALLFALRHNTCMLSTNTKTRFSGSDYQPVRDDVRLSTQLLRVWNAVCTGRWLTLGELESLTGDPPASISAQLRHLRKAKFGAHGVEKEYVGNGLYKYRVIANDVSLVR